MAAADRCSLQERHATPPGYEAGINGPDKPMRGACLCTAACLLPRLCQGFIALRTATATVELKTSAAHPLTIQCAPHKQEMTMGCITHQHHQISLPHSLRFEGLIGMSGKLKRQA